MSEFQRAGDGQEALVLIVDDHPVVRQGLAQFIDTEDDLKVCAQAETAAEALKLLQDVEADVAVIDLALDERLDGLDLIKDIRARHPELPMLVLSMHPESVFAERVLRAGARGYVMKETAMETILTAIRRVVTGEVYLSDRVGKKLLSSLTNGHRDWDRFPADRLTDRELEVFHLIGKGLGTSEIADKLYLSVKTVETYRSRIKSKFRLKTSAQLRQHAIEWVQNNTIK